MAWRGRAAPPGTSAREGMTGEERRRIYIGAALAALGVAALVVAPRLWPSLGAFTALVGDPAETHPHFTRSWEGLPRAFFTYVLHAPSVSWAIGLVFRAASGVWILWCAHRAAVERAPLRWAALLLFVYFLCLHAFMQGWYLLPLLPLATQLPDWSQLPAVGTQNPNPMAGRTADYGGDGVRDAHDGTVVAPTGDPRHGVDPHEVVAYRWTGSTYVEIPVQVDQRFPWFLANGRSDFGIYSGVDMELTYQWDVESWKMTAGPPLSPRHAPPTSWPVGGNRHISM